jgi:hypothetical protein
MRLHNIQSACRRLKLCAASSTVTAEDAIIYLNHERMLPQPCVQQHLLEQQIRRLPVDRQPPHHD